MVADSEVLELSFRTDLGLLFGRWQRPATDDEVRLGYEATLAEAAPHGARYWLLDLRRRGTFSTEVVAWLVHTFAPRLKAGLSGPVYIAFLAAPDHLQALPLQQHLPLTGTPDWQASTFTDEGQALRWLNTCRAQNGDA
ncbi:hypothetical protein F0P96_15230 [Hymenobacter busanensis]|uniref:Uncharacterized protein n=1 Tax=Hymenobacter busanensis TaxID=2607656 RepID=A0A7L5A0W6_9BACT|nr:hypothetical protein [Hymenobacter busanensis]KAA9331584.1 hypothetical protein F0P96_15230 [Hymenobacter busanensis]QHJ08736.1 hypothetical protein GUY19_16165 [Hymenobacter busanensis]